MMAWSLITFRYLLVQARPLNLAGLCIGSQRLQTAEDFIWILWIVSPKLRDFSGRSKMLTYAPTKRPPRSRTTWASFLPMVRQPLGSSPTRRPESRAAMLKQVPMVPFMYVPLCLVVGPGKKCQSSLGMYWVSCWSNTSTSLFQTESPESVVKALRLD